MCCFNFKQHHIGVGVIIGRGVPDITHQFGETYQANDWVLPRRLVRSTAIEQPMRLAALQRNRSLRREPSRPLAHLSGRHYSIGVIRVTVFQRTAWWGLLLR